jgi:hypothetical protein
MTTLSANKVVWTFGDANYTSVPVSASQNIYQGSLVALDPYGYALPATDTASLTGSGVAVTQANNSAGANGAIRCDVYTHGRVSIKVTGSVQVGSKVYVADSGAAAQSGSFITKGVYVGRVQEANSEISGEYWVLLEGPRKTIVPGTPPSLGVNDES